jgi:hypothetical protein
VGWGDRNDIAESLDGAMRTAGLSRSEPLSRISHRMPIKGPFNVPADELEATAHERRAGLLRVLASIPSAGGVIDFYVFHICDGSLAKVKEEVIRLLGAPDSEVGALLAWSDGLKVRLVASQSGPLGQRLPYYELSQERKDGLTKRQQEALRKAGQKLSNDKSAEAMREHVARTRGGRTGVACAILEMAASLQNEGTRDPYALGRQQLAKQRILPQVVLVDNEAPEKKYRSAVRDCLRMLGVLPAFEDRLPLLPAAFTIIQRNDETVDGGTIKSQAFPLAARVRKDGVVECALPDESGAPVWMPYALAALRVFAGEYGRYSRNRANENLAKFGAFFTTVLEQIDAQAAGGQGGALVLVDADTTANRIQTLENGHVAFDRLQIGSRIVTPANLPRTRIVRVCANAAKLPSYMQTEGQWPQGLFKRESASRTAYGVKKKPPSAKTVSRMSTVSRHLAPGDNRAADNKVRRIAALDELCDIFQQDGDEPASLLMIAHRLRSVHTQFDEDTSLPFPLHELRLLADAVTS